MCPGSLLWPGVEPGLKPEVLPSPHCKSRVVPDAGQATAAQLRDLASVILGTLSHCDTVWPRASHLTSLLSNRAKGKPFSQGCDVCPMKGRLGWVCRE